MTLSIHHLAFQRNNALLFSEIHFELQAGNILEVRGANGCGKSTLLRILAGYIQPETGSIIWQGNNIFKTLDDYTAQLCYLGHHNGIKPYLTVYENLKLACALSGIKIAHDIFKKIIKKMQLEHAENTQAHLLSAGQKRRLALSRLLLTPARLWILDEPTTALDHAGIHLFTDLLKQHLAQDGMAIVATHHDLDIKNIHTLELKNREASYV